MRTMRYYITFSVLLVTLSGPVSAQVGPQGLVPFKDFIQSVPAADFGKYLTRSTSRVKTAGSFEQMRRHLLNLYQGVEVSHSFLLDSRPFDCVPVAQQPSVRLLGLKSIAPPPQSAAPGEPQGASHLAEESATSAPQLGPAAQVDEFGNSVHCEAHTIPVRRITLEELSRFDTLQQFFEKGPAGAGRPLTQGQAIPPAFAGHKYAYTIQYVNNLGGSSTLNLWRPYVRTNLGQVFSLSQEWYVGGTGANTQTVEGGWQNFPGKYGTENSVLFIYWTADNYNRTGCYNLDCAAFVQTNNNWYLGGTFSRYSTYGGAQYDFTLKWYLYQGNWWLQLAWLNQAAQWVGYYPGSIYRGGQLARNAQLIEYGGVVTAVPRLAPSSLNCTRMTPTLSEAVADTVTTVPDTVVPLAGAVRDTVGGAASDVPGAPEITPAVAASRASMLAPMSVPSVAAFLYVLEAARR